MKEEPLLLAVDFGTTHIKAAAFTASGRQEALEVAGTPMIADAHGVYCIDPDGAAKALLQVLARVAARLPGREAAGIGIASMAEAFVAMDADMRPLRPIMIWTDLRTAGETRHWAEARGAWELYLKTGIVWHPKYTLGKLVWMRENEPELFARMRRWLCMQSYVSHLLTGEYFTEHSVAQRTFIYNLRDAAWDRETQTELNLDPDTFPLIRASGHWVAGLSAGAAAATGLKQGTPVFLGGHDHQCAAHGVGVVQPGSIFSSMGTAEAALCLDDAITQDEKLFAAGLTLHPFVSGGYCHMGSIQSSGGSFEWFAEHFLAGEGESAYKTA